MCKEAKKLFKKTLKEELAFRRNKRNNEGNTNKIATRVNKDITRVKNK